MRLDLASVLDFYGVDYRPHRITQKVLCVVHGESDPSCNVDFEKGLWFCHSCGEGGTALDMVMVKEGLDFESARKFAEEQGIGTAGGGGGGQALGLVGRKVPARRDRQRKRGYTPPWSR